MLAKDRIRFFSHDVDMRNDLKIRGLRRQFGNEGYAVWCYLLEILTDSECLSVDIEAMGDLLAADFDIERELLYAIIGYCTSVGLFIKDGSILYSQRHRERIKGVMDKAQEKSERGRKAVMARWGKNSESNTDETEEGTGAIQPNTNKRREDKTREDKTREEKRVEYPCDDIVKIWNEECASLPKVQRLNDARRGKIKARLKVWGYNTPEAILENARTLFRRIEASDFLAGRSGRWKATFDWLFENDKNWVKVMEGNYDNQRGGASPAPSSTKTLGVGEYINQQGNRTYGSGRAIIPQGAPPRPSARHSWNASNNQWIIE